MEEYHIGKEIEKEVRKQYPSIEAFAKALNRERQTAYDIFSRAHMATDKLFKISKLLNRDFFKELSDIYKNGRVANEEEERVIKERISMLMPEDELHIIDESQFENIADEYFSNTRKKPLLICIDKKTAPDVFHEVCERIFGKGMVKIVETGRMAVASLESQLNALARLPQEVIEIYWSRRDYDDIILLAEKLATSSDKFVILYWWESNGLISGSYETIEYDDIVERCFNTWNKRIHMFVADSVENNFCRRLEIFNSSNPNWSKSKGYITRICHLFEKGEKEKAREVLEEAFEKRKTFKVFKEEDLEYAIRRYVVSAEPTDEEMKQFERSLKSMRFTMWYNVSKEGGEILNCEHTSSGIMEHALLDDHPDSRKAFDEYKRQQKEKSLGYLY